MKNTKIIDEYPLLVLPTLACALGLNEAIAVQQIHYWLQNPKIGKRFAGRKWVSNTAKEWQKDNFKFWSLSTIQRVFESLRNEGYVLTTAALNKAPMDQTLWYAVDYDNVAKAVEAWQAAHPDEDPFSQDDEMELVNLNKSISSDRLNDSTETTQRLQENIPPAADNPVKVKTYSRRKVVAPNADYVDLDKSKPERTKTALEIRLMTALPGQKGVPKVFEQLNKQVFTSRGNMPSPNNLWDTVPLFCQWVEQRIGYWQTQKKGDRGDVAYLVNLLKQYDGTQYSWMAFYQANRLVQSGVDKKEAEVKQEIAKIEGVKDAVPTWAVNPDEISDDVFDV